MTNILKHIIVGTFETFSEGSKCRFHIQLLAVFGKTRLMFFSEFQLSVGLYSCSQHQIVQQHLSDVEFLVLPQVRMTTFTYKK